MVLHDMKIKHYFLLSYKQRLLETRLVKMSDSSSYLFLKLVSLFAPQLIPHVNQHLVKMEEHALWWPTGTNAPVRQDLWEHTVNVSFITHQSRNIHKALPLKAMQHYSGSLHIQIVLLYTESRSLSGDNQLGLRLDLKQRFKMQCQPSTTQSCIQ